MPPRPTSCTVEQVPARCECRDYSLPGPSPRDCHLRRPLVVICAMGLQSLLYWVEKPLRIRQVMSHVWHTAGHACTGIMVIIVFLITTARARPTCHFWTLIPLHVLDWEGLIKLSLETHGPCINPLIPEESPALPVKCNYTPMHCSTN